MAEESAETVTGDGEQSEQRVDAAVDAPAPAGDEPVAQPGDAAADAVAVGADVGETIAANPETIEPTGETIPPAPETQPASTAPPSTEPASIDTVMRAVKASAGEPAPYRTRFGEFRLTTQQAELQQRIHNAATAQGIPLRRTSDVYGWLLDQIAASLAD